MKRFFCYLSLLGCLSALPSCHRSEGSLTDLESAIDDLSAKSSQLKKAASALRSELTLLRESMASMAAELDKTCAQAIADSTQQKQIVENFANYRIRYHDSMLKRAPGMVLGDLTIQSVAYHNVRVKSLDNWDLSFIHADGFSRVALKDLPDNLKNLFAFDPTAGPKPEQPLAGIPRTLDIPANPPEADTGTYAGVAPQAASGSAAPAGKQAGGNTKLPAGGASKASNSGNVDILNYWGPGGEHGPGSGSLKGSKTKGATSPLPPGYKPIGSSFSGSSMTKKDEKDKDKK